MPRWATTRFQWTEQTFAGEGPRRLLEQSGLVSVDAVYARSAATHHRHSGRGVCEFLLDSDGGPVRVFAKLNWGRQRFWPRMTDLKTGQVFQTHPEREWCGLGNFAELGINVPERLALFRTGWFSFRAAILVRAVPAEHSVDALLHSRAWWRFSADDRSAILNEMAATLRCIHTAGYAWRGTSSRHFFPQQQPDGRWKLWLIDCEGVHRLTSRRAIDRDHQKLLRSMQESGADEATLAELQRQIESGGTVRRAA